MGEHYPGFRFVIEGNDGTGKSTQTDMLLWQFYKNGYDTIRIDEPDSARDLSGKTLVPVSELLRTVVKDGESYTSNQVADLAMYNVSRFANWNLATLPGLLKGAAAGQARDYSSSLIYQGAGEGVSFDEVEAATRAIMQDERYFRPDYKTVLAFDNEEARLRRLENRGAVQEAKDKFEMRGEDFQQRVNQAYMEIAKRDNIPVTFIEEGETREEIADTILSNMMGATGLQLVHYDWAEYQEFRKAA